MVMHLMKFASSVNRKTQMALLFIQSHGERVRKEVVSFFSGATHSRTCPC